MELSQRLAALSHRPGEALEEKELQEAVVIAGRVAGIYTDVYTRYMAMRAKLFQNGGSQAVRLPKECRFPDEPSEVLVRREGRRVILEPLDEWPAELVEILGAWSEPIERPRQRAVRELRDPFR